MKQIQVIFILITLILSLQVTEAQKCRALVIEGGGDLGAYEAGVLKGLIYNLPNEQVQWDVLSGISVGSILSAGFGQYAKGDEKAAVDWIISMWENISKDNVYKNWSPGGLAQGLLFEPGIFNTEPLRKFLNANINRPMQRKINIGATDVNTGELIRFSENLSHDDLVNAVVSSAAVPMVFPYTSFENHVFFDGGVAHMMDVPGAVQRCYEITQNKSDIIVDIIMIASKKMEPWPPNPDMKPFDSYGRFSDLKSYEKTWREYLEAQENFPDVNYRYFIHPSAKLPDASFPFFFNHQQLLDMIEIGYQDALKAIQQGEGVSAKLGLKEAYEVVLSRQNPQKYKHPRHILPEKKEQLEIVDL